VTTDNFAFLPTALQVKVGQEVTWATQQDVAHTVTADEGAFAHSMPAGARFALPSPSGQLRLPLHRSPGDARDDRGFVAVRP
jgi:plastocyanin